MNVLILFFLKKKSKHSLYLCETYITENFIFKPKNLIFSFRLKWVKNLVKIVGLVVVAAAVILRRREFGLNILQFFFSNNRTIQ